MAIPGAFFVNPFFPVCGLVRVVPVPYEDATFLRHLNSMVCMAFKRFRGLTAYIIPTMPSIFACYS